MKIDGHTHTELCPHGSGEPVEKMIQKAIMQGLITIVLRNMHHYRVDLIKNTEVVKKD
ncbi:hypothetical protein JCM15457_2448 [Liquorilactobacillus sucicola DSM 21376 = JCM 15457]|nr:hypothetical protein JCM15457_2448 [Liquorilactobacillus sucicola DSM 21376 = JCM 15457]